MSLCLVDYRRCYASSCLSITFSLMSTSHSDVPLRRSLSIGLSPCISFFHSFPFRSASFLLSSLFFPPLLVPSLFVPPLFLYPLSFLLFSFLLILLSLSKSCLIFAFSHHLLFLLSFSRLSKSLMPVVFPTAIPALSLCFFSARLSSNLTPPLSSTSSRVALVQHQRPEPYLVGAVFNGRSAF